MASTILFGLHACTVISILLFTLSLQFHLRMILPNRSLTAFKVRRPYYISFATLLISIMLLLRCIATLLFYHSFISIIFLREIFRFLFIFGELQCIIQRILVLWFDQRHRFQINEFP